ncbi:MAG: SDR family oxidoreductase [Chitinophagales bacterium]|nr:SDR family oxidoreductase [Chitinophagales bacterium]MDW8427876.1 SDR family oxidoreductase [Chitinophagales bacterium]
MDAWSAEPVFHEGSLEGVCVLVTGGAGFIGSHLVAYLLEHGAFVRVLDNLATGKLQNVKRFRDHPRFEFQQGDIRNFEDCCRACTGMSFVLHQAAIPSVTRSVSDPLTTHQVNCDGFMHMLLAARQAGVRRLVYASSSSVYGDAQQLPMKEEYIGRPLSPYAVSKLTNELFAEVFMKNYGMELIGLRYFNVFGPRQDPENPYAAVIPRFLHALRQGQQPIIYGDGMQSRDFTYVSNAVQANIKAMLTQNQQALGSVFNVACGESHSVLRLFDLMKQLMLQAGYAIPSSLTPQHHPPRQGEIRHSQADINRARQLLGYQPTVLLEEGLRRLIRCLT